MQAELSTWQRQQVIAQLRTLRPSTAYHEAGHAVVGAGLGLPTDSVTIKPDLERLTAGKSVQWFGFARNPATGEPWDAAQLLRVALVVTAAGCASANLFGFTGEDQDYFADDRPGSDLSHAWELVNEALPAATHERKHEWIVTGHEMAKTCVAGKTRPVIEAVAQRLLQVETIHREELLDLIGLGLDGMPIGRAPRRWAARQRRLRPTRWSG